jgi:hypothetical protein
VRLKMLERIQPSLAIRPAFLLQHEDNHSSLEVWIVLQSTVTICALGSGKWADDANSFLGHSYSTNSPCMALDTAADTVKVE